MNNIQILEFLYQNRKSSKTVLIDDHSHLSYNQLWHSATIWSTILQQTCNSQYAMVCMKNSNIVVVIYLACWLAKKVVVPIDPNLTDREIDYLINIVVPAYAFFDNDRDVAFIKKNSYDIIVFSAEAIEAQLQNSQRIEDLPDPLPNFNTNDVALILFSSGTSGKPKGVIHSHGNLSLLAWNYVAEFGFTAKTVMLVSRPVSNVSGFFEVMGGLLSWAKIIIQNSPSCELLANNLKKYAVTYMSLPVSSIYALLKQPFNKKYFTHMDYIRTGGSPVPKLLQEKVFKKFGISIVVSYGLTECGTVMVNRANNLLKIESMGNKPSDGVYFKIDTTVSSAENGNIGELNINSNGMFLSYFKDIAKTNAALSNEWFKTGDIVEVDKDGYYWFIARKDDLIITDICNISPAEIEHCLLENEFVTTSAVVGIKKNQCDETLQIIIAFVTLKLESLVSENELINFLSSRLTKSKIPNRIIVIRNIPTLATGKIDYPTLKQLAQKYI